jgi:serine protease Do
MSFLRNKRIAALCLILGCTATAPLSMSQVFSLFQDGVTGAYLGISMEDVTAANMAKYKLNSEKGVIVSSVKKGSPAEEATIKEDDVILEFGGFPIWSSSQLSHLVLETPVGRKADLVVSRDGKQLKLSAMLASRDPQREDNGGENKYSLPFPAKPYNFQRESPDVPANRDLMMLDRKPRLGITLQPLTDQLAEFLGVSGKNGVLITSVIDGSPSEGKLRSGDVVIAADDKEIGSPAELIGFIEKAPSGRITLKIVRDKKSATVVIDLPSLDDNKKGYRL